MKGASQFFSRFPDSPKNVMGENESGSDIQGYTPPPPGRKRKLSLQQDFHGIGEIQRPVTHEFMSHKTGTHEFMSHKTGTHEFMSHKIQKRQNMT